MPQGRESPEGRLARWRLGRQADKVARKPHGRKARATYGAPDVHSFAWPTVLGALELTKDDRLLDVGCGGGSFLRHVRETIGCEVAGLDHSRDMVKLAAPFAALGDADALPFETGYFTAVASIAAFFWFPDPVAVLREMRRVLDPERGRLAVFTTAPEAKGSIAAPYPLANLGRFYTDDELLGHAHAAGLSGVRLAHREDWAQLLVAQP